VIVKYILHLRSRGGYHEATRKKYKGMHIILCIQVEARILAVVVVSAQWLVRVVLMGLVVQAAAAAVAVVVEGLQLGCQLRVRSAC
jgi:hypothetical protein